MAKVSIWEIKKRIVEILKADPELHPYKNSKDTPKAIRLIKAGAPWYNDMKNVSVTPAVFVTNDNVIDDITQEGTINNDKHVMLGHKIRLLILIVTSGKDGFHTEEQADNFADKICEVIESNYSLKKPNTPDAESLVLYSRPETVAVLDQKVTGSGKQGRVIRLQILVNS